METNETSLKDEIKSINQNFQKLLESGKVKGVKLRKTPSKGQLKKNYLYYIYIKENGEISPMKTPVQEGTTVIDGIPRIATPEYTLTYKGKPAIIQDALCVRPYSREKEFSEAVKDQMTVAGYKLLINRIEQGALKTKKKISGAMIFFIIIALIVIGYLAIKGFG